MRWTAPLAVLMLCILLHGAVDASNPKSAARSFLTAMESSDTEALKQLIYVANDPEDRLVSAYADLILAGKALGEAARQKFPGSSSAFSQGTLSPEDAANIERGEVKIDGDHATITIAGRADPMKLKKVNGAWRFIVSEEPADSTAKARADQLALIRGLAEAINGCAADISADKFSSMQDAENAVKERLGAILSRALRNDLPASRPTTRP